MKIEKMIIDRKYFLIFIKNEKNNIVLLEKKF